MAWYPGATKMELQPESDSQAGIRPTQFIMHSIAAPWTARRMYEYWRDSTNLESHFGLGFEGDLAQYIGTETRADANYQANRRPDGTGAVSIETASNLQHTDPWTDQQVEQLIRLGVWLHQQHGIPLRICQAHDDPGFGYHRLHSAWAVSGTACPGDARVRQFKDVVFPGIVACAKGQTPTPAPSEEDDDVTIQKLVEANPTDVLLLPEDGWIPLAFTDAVIHSGPRKLIGPAYVQLTFDAATPADAVVTGQFYSTNADGTGASGYGDIGPVPAQGGVQFLHNYDVPEGKHLRFRVKVATADGSAVKLIHRVVTSDFAV